MITTKEKEIGFPFDRDNRIVVDESAYDVVDVTPTPTPVAQRARLSSLPVLETVKQALKK